MRRLTASVILIGASLAVGLGAQGAGTTARVAPVSKGLIVGRVVDAVTSAPIPSVIVSLAGVPLDSSIRVLADSQGRFLFRNVPKGSFTLRATIGGSVQNTGFVWAGGFGPQVGPYLNGGYGQRRPGGLLQSIDLADGEQNADVVIRLWKGGSIDGTVFDEAGEPLVDVVVAAPRRTSDGRLLNGPTVRTNDRGAYHFGTLVPDDYVIVVPQLQGAMPSDTNDTLSATPNKPVSARLANTMAPNFSGGIAVGSSLITTTVSMNTNVLTPVPRGDVMHIYQTTFAPSATSLATATTVRVGAGEARAGVDVTMLPVRPVAVSGTVRDDLGPLSNFGVRLFTREEPGTVPLDLGWTSTDASGRFIFPLVPPGTYRVAAQRYATTQFGADVVLPPPGPPRAADRMGASSEQVITVGDRDVTDIALQLRLGVQVSGRVEFRGSGNRPSANAIRELLVFLSPFEPISHMYPIRPHSMRIDARDGFAFRDIPPGRYVLTVNDSPDASLLSVSVAGKPVAERPVVIGTANLSDVTIELTDRPAEVTGTARSRTGAPDPDASVVLFPTDRNRWSEIRTGARMFRSARVSKTGAFTVRPVLPGEYFITAVADDATADFPEPKFLEALALVATTVRVGTGDKQNVALTTVDAPVVKAPSIFVDGAVADELVAHGPFVDDSANASRPVTPVLIGIVTTDETQARPLRHAIVTATAAEIPGPRQVVTDDEGRFVFSDLPPGRYSLVAEKAGYVKTFYGSKRPGGTPGTPVAVLAGQPPPNIAIRVPPGAVIAGTVRDQFGTPVSSAEVSVKQSVVVNGRRRMSDVPNLRVPVTSTDDQGRYRIYGLPPGEYAVFCSLPTLNYGSVRETNSADVDAVLRELRTGGSAAVTSAPPRQITLSGGYLPGVPDADSAQLIPLGVGEERAGADILIGALHALTVSGTSLGPGGRPMRNIMIAVVNRATGTRIGSGGVIMPGTDGRFGLSALPPGRYTLMGRAAENNAGETDDMPYFAETEFVLSDQNISGIVLQFERGVTVTGRIVPPANAAAGAVANVRLAATPVESYQSLVPARVIATTRADGTFIFDGVGPGSWRVTGASLPQNWSLRSAMLDGRDTLDVPFEIRLGQPVIDLVVTMTDQVTELNGAVLDASGRPTSEYSVLAFSTERALWATAPRRVSGAARLSSDGHYRIRGLPPGEYYLAVLTDFDPARSSDVSLLESLIPSAVKVTIGEGERKTQDYRIR